MDLELTGKTILITGGSKGIGLACARGFAAEGARVAIASRDAANLETASRRLRDDGVEVVTVRADLKDPDQAARMVQEAEAALGPVDVLVNSAGAAQRTPPDELTPAHWHAAMEAKYFTYVHAIDAALRSMAARRTGAIVNVVGAGGKLPPPTHLTGGGANAALMLITAGLANVYASKGIRINAVNPGITHTERLNRSISTEASLRDITEEEALERLVAAAPLGRLAQPSEIADVVVFLASARASYVSGAIIALDGAATPTVV